MKVLMFSGTHPRHLYVHKAVMDSGADCAAVVMQREALLPSYPPGMPVVDQVNFKRHFRDRLEIEEATFGDFSAETFFSDIPHMICEPETLNTTDTAEFVSAYNPDWVFVFGPDLIKEPLLSVLPKDTVNLHLGLSPWYRGSATLFWPFYFLQPQFAGATFHQVIRAADAGAILHQSIPTLMNGDGIHDVGVRTVIQARMDFEILLKNYSSSSDWHYINQKSSGRLFLTRDFHPAHLRVIYNTFNNNIVDEYLDGNLGDRKPSLIKSPVLA